MVKLVCLIMTANKSRPPLIGLALETLMCCADCIISKNLTNEVFKEVKATNNFYWVYGRLLNIMTT